MSCSFLCLLFIQTSVTDVLTAMGAIPSGFRPSTTAKLLREGIHVIYINKQKRQLYIDLFYCCRIRTRHLLLAFVLYFLHMQQMNGCEPQPQVPHFSLGDTGFFWCWQIRSCGASWCFDNLFCSYAVISPVAASNNKTSIITILQLGEEIRNLFCVMFPQSTDMHPIYS